ncbi:MAG: valine--tRNA ligase [Bacillota bacterium]
MSELSKTYDPDQVEDKWYQYWEDKGYFQAEVDEDRPSFSIVMPPPNITGQLHMGHALDNTLQDILTRWKRMQGSGTLWLPGTDHASIATEVKVVNKLRNQGIEKDDVGREGFLEEAWEWKEEYGNTITNQLRKMGSSCDWSRERFTLDEGCSEAVKEVFVQLYERDLIYRGDYIVNWCPDCRTTLSDIEVEHEEHTGKLYHIEYPLVDGDDYIVVATTRPETMLGDTAVAVNPDDERYADLVGEKVLLPLMEREIPIIADEFVDSEFGTGMVKVTPAHDPNDFEMGQRHDLEVIKVIGEDGVMTEEAGDYAAMDRYECREKLICDLDAMGLLRMIQDYEHSVGQCYRCDTVIEPMVSKQWFVKMDPLAEPAIEAVKEGDIRFVPERFSRVYLNWMENIRDWCISRQLWWGHRIPVWYCQDCDEVIVSREEPETCPKCERDNLKQDEDVLDTWFSSALWPFSTMGWPEDTDELEYFYPTDVLVTGRDIIFFWVARMIFMGLEFMDQVPFFDVYVHGLIRDAQGRKMSKSLGNGIDPLDVVEEYGADALRFTLITGNTPGNDMRFREEKLEASRNFANKIWNASRFVLMNIEDLDYENVDQDELEYTLADRWMFTRLQEVTEKINQALERYDFGAVSKTLYDFIWNEFCDWYIEMLKIRLYQDEDKQAYTTAQYNAVTVLETILRLLHPVMPFITEEIWQQLPAGKGDTIMHTDWPEIRDDLLADEANRQMAVIMDVVRGIRNIRNQMKVNPGKDIRAIFEAKEERLSLLQQGQEYIAELASVGEMEFAAPGAKRPDKVSTAVVGEIEIVLPLEDMIDIDKEIERIKGEIEDVEGEIKRAEGKLDNQGFVENAPEDIVQAERDKLKEYKSKKEKLQENLVELEK